MISGWESTTLNPNLIRSLQKIDSGLAVASKNGEIATSQLLRVAGTYYNARYTWNEAQQKYVPTFQYAQEGTALDANYSQYLGQNRIDCSTYIGLLLRGLTAQKSPYGPYVPEESQIAVNPEEDDDYSSASTDSNIVTPGKVPCNSRDYPWAVELDNAREPRTTTTTSQVRTAAQLAQYLVENGCVIDQTDDFNSVEPGDIIFWNTTKNGNNRFMDISHVAMCYSKLEPPEDAYVPDTSVNEVTISSFNAQLAKQALDTMYFPDAKDPSDADAVYLVTRSDAIWKVFIRGPKVDGEWTWLNGQNVNSTVSGDTVTLTTLGIVVTLDAGATSPSFQIVRYHWLDKYPYRHMMLEVTDTSPYVLCRVLEKCYPQQVVLVCRPDLGSMIPGDFAGDLTDRFNIDNIDGLFRPGVYYLTSSIVSTFPTGISNGNKLSLKVIVTQTQQGKIESVTQLLWNAETAKMYFRSQWCNNHLPTSDIGTDGWSAWRVFIDDSDIDSTVQSKVRTEMGNYHRLFFSSLPIGTDVGRNLSIPYSNIYPTSLDVSVGDSVIGSDGYVGNITATGRNITVLPTGKGLENIFSDNVRTNVLTLRSNGSDAVSLKGYYVTPEDTGPAILELEDLYNGGLTGEVIIRSVADPQYNGDAANKGYVDNAILGALGGSY